MAKKKKNDESLDTGKEFMKFWKALLSCLLGVMIAGVVMTLISYGAVAIFA